MKKLCILNNDILTVHVKWDFNKHVEKQQSGSHTHTNFTLERCLKRMNLYKYRESLQHASGVWVIRKSKETLRLVKEWL